MIVNKAELECVAVKPEQYPQSDLWEFAFAGRSNVGKSSLINTMLGRKSLARVSQTPGKTRTINFYNVDDRLYFVDLPGYGFAKAPVVEIKKWGDMIEKYLKGRKQLRGIVLILDIRHKPTENDIMMYNWIKYYGYEVIIAATKLDKIKKSQVNKHLEVLRQALGFTQGRIIPFSSHTKEGRDGLWGIIEENTGIIG